MKKFILASLLFATPVLAQQQTGQQQTPPPGMRAWQLMQGQCDMREQNATAAALGAQDQIQALQQKVSELQKELDDTKTKKPDEKK